MAVQIEIPPLSYFETGNPFTGSHGQIFRFHVSRAEEELVAETWYADICYELAEHKTEARFPLTDAGRADCKAWLETQCEQQEAEHRK